MRWFRQASHILAQGQEIIHIDTDSLAFTELTADHIRVLKLVDEEIAEDQLRHQAEDLGLSSELEELIELEVLSERQPPKPLPMKSLDPVVSAFRIVLTEKCNLACVECFVTKYPDILNEMSMETLEQFVAYATPFGKASEIMFHFFGGEPLIRFNLIQRAVELLQQAVENGAMVQPRYMITTNLVLLNNEIASFFSEHNFQVGVSIDGPQEINDVLRPRLGGQGSFAKVATHYRMLEERGIQHHVLVTPHPNHLKRIPSIVSTLLQLFSMKTMTINTPLHYHTLQWTLPGKQFAKTLLEVYRIANEHGVTIDSAASPPLAAITNGLQREAPCALICDQIMASVSPQGEISFCSQKWHPSLVTLPTEKTVTIPLDRKDDCVTCEAHSICGGPCPAFQRISGEELDENKCDFMRAFLPIVAANLDLFAK